MDHSRAQIIATIGPASFELKKMRLMVESGVDVVLFDFSQDTLENHRKTILNSRNAAKENGRYIPIIGSLSGPQLEKNALYTDDQTALSVITDKDREDIGFCIEQNIDYITLPHLGSVSDVNEIRSIAEEYDERIKVIAKIEKKDSLRNIKTIISEVDAILIERVSLSKEIPIEQTPYIQDKIIKEAKWTHTPVIVAGDTLPSMINSNKPSRTEVSDIAHAIITGCDAVVLGEETATGAYPVETVSMLERVILEAERHMTESNANLL